MLSLLNLILDADHFALSLMTGSSMRVYGGFWSPNLSFMLIDLFLLLLSCLLMFLITFTAFVVHLLAFYIEIETIVVVRVSVEVVFGGVLSQILV